MANRTSMLKEFRAFVLRGNVVDLAVAVVIGAAFGALVKSLVDNIFTPLIAAIIGKPDFGDLTFTIHHGVFRYGLVINDLITFLSIAAVVFFVVVKPLNTLAERRKRGEIAEPEAQPEDIILLTEIRDLLARSPS